MAACERAFYLLTTKGSLNSSWVAFKRLFFLSIVFVRSVGIEKLFCFCYNLSDGCCLMPCQTKHLPLSPPGIYVLVCKEKGGGEWRLHCCLLWNVGEIIIFFWTDFNIRFKTKRFDSVLEMASGNGPILYNIYKPFTNYCMFTRCWVDFSLSLSLSLYLFMSSRTSKDIPRSCDTSKLCES